MNLPDSRSLPGKYRSTDTCRYFDQRIRCLPCHNRAGTSSDSRGTAGAKRPRTPHLPECPSCRPAAGAPHLAPKAGVAGSNPAGAPVKSPPPDRSWSGALAQRSVRVAKTQSEFCHLVRPPASRALAKRPALRPSLRHPRPYGHHHRPARRGIPTGRSLPPVRRDA